MRLLESIHRDVVFALRSFGRSPGFVTAVVISIALGIAANTIVFSIANGLLMRDLPIRDARRLFAVQAGGGLLSYPQFTEFSEQNALFDGGLAAYCPLAPASANPGTKPERVWGQMVSGNYFTVIGAPLTMGRGIVPDEDQAAGRNPVVVLSHSLWQRFGARRDMIGNTIILNGTAYTIIGVTAPGFFGMDRGIVADFWVPIAMRKQIVPDFHKEELTNRDMHWLEVTGRLRPGVSVQHASAALNVVAGRVHRTLKKDGRPPVIALIPAGQLPGIARVLSVLIITLGIVVGLVLLIACANVANLMLARAASRQKEIGVRLAIGAGRGRLIRQLLTESLILSAFGAAAGLLLSTLASEALSRFQLPLPFPIRFDLSPDWRVLVFTAAVSAFTGVLFGLVPALHSTRPDLINAIRAGTALGGFGKLRLQSLLVAAQVTMSLVLLVITGLSLRSLQTAASLDFGIKPEGVLMFALDTKAQGYSGDKSRVFFDELERRVTGIPGAASMSYTRIAPLSLAESSDEFTSTTLPDKKTIAYIFDVGPRYFETMGMRILRGRDFDRTRDVSRPMVVINQQMAEKLFSRQDPVGQAVRQQKDIYEVIGVVTNSKATSIEDGQPACAFRYLPRDFDRAISFLGITVVVKGTVDPASLVRPVRKQVETLDPNLAVFGVESMTDHLSRALIVPRLCAWLFGAFGLVGLALAAVGLYGVLSYYVRTRTREIGIRIALGASVPSLIGAVVRRALWLVLSGLVIGLGIAFALARFAASLLFGVQPGDPVAFIGVPLVLLLVAAVAAFEPAARAASVDPIDALRAE